MIDQIVKDDKSVLISKLDFRSDKVKRRIINMDKETSHDLLVTAEKGGPRAISYHNPMYKRVGKQAVKRSCHGTGVYATSAAGKTLPPMYVYNSSTNLWFIN